MVSLAQALQERYPELTPRQIAKLSTDLDEAVSKVKERLANPLLVPKVTLSAHIDTHLGEALATFRNHAKLTQVEAASKLDWSHSKLIRIELNVVSVSVTDLRALLKLYRVSDEAVSQILIEEARRIHRALRGKTTA